jgi:hypothetical protein
MDETKSISVGTPLYVDRPERGLMINLRIAKALG